MRSGRAAPAGDPAARAATSGQLRPHDADVAAAIAGSAQDIFFNQGEVCTAASRPYIQERLFDEVSKAAHAIKVGHGMQPDTEMGPLGELRAVDRVTGYLKIGADQGARQRHRGAGLRSPTWRTSRSTASPRLTGRRSRVIAL